MPVETKNAAVTTDDSDLLDMSYSKLDQTYSTLTKIKVRDYTSLIGGVRSPWSESKNGKNTGHDQLDNQNNDADVFANFQIAKEKARDYKESPWKIHISIHPGDLGKAWDLIYPLLIKNQVPYFKTVRNSIAQRLLQEIIKVDEQFLTAHNLSIYNKELAIRDNLRITDGMQITIYIPEGKEKEYNKLIETIEPLLYLQGIRPGVIDQSDRSLGLYSSVRHVGEVYKSHEKVAGYKAIEEKDPFRPIEPIWDRIQMKWPGFAYEQHIAKAKLSLQHVIDAERKYKKGTYTKKEFIQVYDVAMEYFKRWRQLLKKEPDLTTLSAKDKQGFHKLKKWIANGYRLLPTIRKDENKKIKEAEDALLSSLKVNTFPLVPVRQLKRQNAQLNLNKHLKKHLNTDNKQNEESSPTSAIVINDQCSIESSAPREPTESSAKVLQKLFLHRKKSFKGLEINHLPQTKSSSLEQEGQQRILPAPSEQVVLNETDERPQSHPNQWRFWGGAVGFSLGLLIALCLTPWTMGISFLTISLSPLIGTITGILIGWGTETLFIGCPIQQEQQSLLAATPSLQSAAESAMEQLSLEPRGAGKLRMFDHKEQAQLTDEEQHQTAARCMKG